MKNYFIFSLILCVLASCANTTTDPLPPEPKMGDKWEYIYRTFSADGNVIDSISVLVNNTSKNSHNGDYIWYENGLYIMTYFPFGRCRMNEDGLYYLMSYGSASEAVCMFRYPSFPGEINYINSLTIVNSNIHTLSTTASVEVPYGSFNSANIYKVNYPTSPKEMIWFNDSVWMIKYERWDSVDANGYYKRFSYELVNYEAH